MRSWISVRVRFGITDRALSIKMDQAFAIIIKPPAQCRAVWSGTTRTVSKSPMVPAQRFTMAMKSTVTKMESVHILMAVIFGRIIPTLSWQVTSCLTMDWITIPAVIISLTRLCWTPQGITGERKIRCWYKPVLIPAIVLNLGSILVAILMALAK